VDDVEQQRIEKQLRQGLAKPRDAAVFDLPQAYSVGLREPVRRAGRDDPICPFTARSETVQNGGRGGPGIVIRDLEG